MLIKLFFKYYIELCIPEYITTTLLTEIPAGACFLTIESEDAGNHLALKWEKTKTFLLNGNWEISKSGNYSIMRNNFVYKKQIDDENGKTSNDKIAFNTQLNEAISVYLLPKETNSGVKYR